VVVRTGVGALVLDLDGVLVDSSQAIFEAWSRWAGGHGVDPVATSAAGQGLPTLDHLRAVRPELATEDEAARRDAGSTR
jgi:sugar-phosphatase